MKIMLRIRQKSVILALTYQRIVADSLFSIVALKLGGKGGTRNRSCRRQVSEDRW